jgi:hypothetical protein
MMRLSRAPSVVVAVGWLTLAYWIWPEGINWSAGKIVQALSAVAIGLGVLILFAVNWSK